MLCSDKCGKCFFSTKLANTGQDVICDYLLITGHKRPCKAGDGCTVRIVKRHRQNVDIRRKLWVSGYFIG